KRAIPSLSIDASLTNNRPLVWVCPRAISDGIGGEAAMLVRVIFLLDWAAPRRFFRGLFCLSRNDEKKKGRLPRRPVFEEKNGLHPHKDRSRKQNTHGSW